MAATKKPEHSEPDQEQVLTREAAVVPKPGSLEAVRKHFGIWRDDPTAETMLAEIYKRRRGEGKE